MPVCRRADMIERAPLPRWRGRCVHSESVTFAPYEVSEHAAPIHERHHVQEEV
jgi:hypothetical protein